MQRAEEATYAEFERLKREVIEPSLSRHDGRLIKTTGDGALVEFASPLAAVRCAVEMQDHLASGSSPFRLRVGLNLGDVIVGQDGELYGAGINIAVRLEGIADPAGIREYVPGLCYLSPSYDAGSINLSQSLESGPLDRPS